MRLNYNILWIDDRHEDLSAYKDDVIDYLKGKYFNHNIFEKTKLDSEDEDLNSLNKYDLILVDYHLESEILGTDVIKRIRDYECYTDVLFYSSLYNEMTRDANISRLNGVHFADRDNLSEILKPLINKTIKRVEELVNLRGLFMGETANLEHKLIDAIKLIEELYPKHEQLKQCYDKSIEEIIDHNLKSIKTFKKDIEKKCVTINDPRIDFYRKFMILKRLLEVLLANGFVKHCELTKKIKNFGDLVNLRNTMAHYKEKEKDDGAIELISHQKGKKALLVTDEMFLDHRKLLISYREMLDELESCLREYI
jgi:CheY-like chemotaxis protein